MDHDHKHNEHADDGSDEEVAEVLPNTQDPHEWRKPGVFCAVCLAIHDGESMYALPCGHAFCLKVIRGLKPPRRGGVGSTIQCPMCRKKHPPSSHRRLFLTLRMPKDRTDIAPAEIDHDHEEICSFSLATCVHSLARTVSRKVDNLTHDSLPATITSVAGEVREVAQKLRDCEADRRDKLSVRLISAVHLTPIDDQFNLTSSSWTRLHTSLHALSRSGRPTPTSPTRPNSHTKR